MIPKLDTGSTRLHFNMGGSLDPDILVMEGSLALDGEGVVSERLETVAMLIWKVGVGKESPHRCYIKQFKSDISTWTICWGQVACANSSSQYSCTFPATIYVN